jgi:hypothetical protein
VNTPSRLDIRHVRNHALKAIATRRLGVSPDYCLLGITREDDGAIIVHVNSGGNVCAVEQWLNSRGYRAEYVPFDGYGGKVRVTLRQTAAYSPSGSGAPDEVQLDRAEVMTWLEGAQARRGDDLHPDSRAEITARLREQTMRVNTATATEERQDAREDDER